MANRRVAAPWSVSPPTHPAGQIPHELGQHRREDDFYAAIQAGAGLNVKMLRTPSVFSAFFK